MTASARMRLVGSDGKRKTSRFTFTVAKLNAVPPPKDGRVFVYDEKRRTLALRVTSSGHKSFYFTKKVNGRPVKMKLGDWPGITIDQARRAAARHEGVAAEGNDPTQARRERRANAQTLGGLRKDYHENHAKPRSKPKTLISETSLYDCHLKRWEARKIAEINPPAVRKLHRQIASGAGERTANRAMQYLRRLYRYARDEHGYKGEIPTDGLTWYTEKQRERYLSPAELQRFLKALANQPQVYEDWFKLALLTGARSANVRAMRWDQLELGAGVWTIPGDEAKEREPIRVPLAPEAVEILERRKQEQAEDPKEYVFPAMRGARKNPYIGSPQRQFQDILKAAKIKDLRIHDLRHTNASYQASGGASLAIIGATLGHRDARSTQRYAHIADDARRRSTESAAKAMLGKESPE